jgi:glycine/D-amino acid oxidase-like deaminating enzyme
MSSVTVSSWFDQARSAAAEAQRELTAERKRATRYLRRAEAAEKENQMLRRRLAGALYQIHGSWAKVNKELG